MECSKVHCVLETADVCEDNIPCWSLDRTSSNRESFTVWMKSLIAQANGCTIFNESGNVVYRMDNYDTKRSREIHLMDLRGRVLFTILKRRFWAFRCWEGHQFGRSASSRSHNNEMCWFRVSKNRGIFKECLHCRVTVFCGKTQTGHYNIEGYRNKPEFNIKNSIGKVVTEVKRKKATSGVYLGEDVWSLSIEPHMDRSFVAALVAVYGSICHRM